MKYPLTPTKAQKVAISLQRLAIIANVLLFESLHELDADFRMPQVNNWAKRIKQDATAIDAHLRNSGWYDEAYIEQTEEYSAELWRSVDLLCSVDVNGVKEFNDYLESRLENIEV